MLKILFCVIVLLSSHVTYSASAKAQFLKTQFETQFNITHPILTANLLAIENQQLVIFGENTNKERLLAIYKINPTNNQATLHQTKKIPNNYLTYGILKKNNQATLVFQTNHFLLEYQPKSNQFKKLFNIDSIYLEKNAQFLAQRKFVNDVNNDGLDDFVIPDFKVVHLYLQNTEGQFIHQTIPVSAKIRVKSQSATYTERPLYFADINFDQKQDIVVVKDSGLTVFYQNKTGGFFSEAKNLALPINVNALEWWEVTESDGESIDQASLSYRSMNQIKDINNDQIADLLVRFSQSEGVLDRQNNYEVYLGKKLNNRLSFSSTPDSVIMVDGTTVGIKTIDIDGDKRAEIILSSLDIGVSQIIGALLSGSIDQDIYIFKMNNSDQYDEDPIVSKEVELNFSLSSGQSGEPVVQLADFNGDGLKDLVLSSGEKNLKFFYANQKKKKKRVFQRRSKKYKVLLPKDGKKLEVKDLNQDGKQDIIIRYGRQDDKTLNNKVILLFAK